MQLCRLYIVFVFTCSLKFIFLNFKTIFLHSLKLKQYRERKWLTAPYIVSISRYGWSFRTWSLHKGYTVMGNKCYIFSANILFAFKQSSCYKSYV